MRNLAGMSAAAVALAGKLCEEFEIVTTGRFCDEPVDISPVDEGDVALFLSRSPEFTLTWPRPIPVSERLPENDHRILVARPGGRGEDGVSSVWQIGRYNHASKLFQTRDPWPDRSRGGDWHPVYNATHWLPLPPSPEQ